MDWKDKTVSMGLVDKEEFDCELATVIVSENRVTVEKKDVDDWERIENEFDDEIVLDTIHWDEVHDVVISDESLYYPYIEFVLERQDEYELRERRRIYFTEDEEDKRSACFTAIKQFRRQHLQHYAPGDPTRDINADDIETPDDEVALVPEDDGDTVTVDDGGSDRADTARETPDDQPDADTTEQAAGTEQADAAGGQADTNTSPADERSEAGEDTTGSDDAEEETEVDSIVDEYIGDSDG